MNAIASRIQELQQYSPARTAAPDLDSFWQRTCKEARDLPFRAEKELQPTLIQGMSVYAVSFDSFGETRISGRLIVPQATNDGRSGTRFPCVTVFPGYTNAMDHHAAYAHWTMMGVAVLALDVRGQAGESGNRLGSDYGMTKGWITEGILDPHSCYYKALAIDAWRALEWVSVQPEIDASRIAAVGASQGGGLALLAAALHSKVSLAVADIPNMCHMDFGILHSTGSLTEAAEFCRKHPAQTEAVLRTLSYFDMLNLAARVNVPLLMSVGLKDSVCMPEQIFPVYERIASADKQLAIYPFTGHAVETDQWDKMLRFVHDKFDLSAAG